MAAAALTPRAMVLAAVAAGILSSCAGGQKPGPSGAGAGGASPPAGPVASAPAAPPSPRASFEAALALERAGDASRAEAAWLAAVEAHPDFAPAGQNLARCWLRQGLSPDEVVARLRPRLERGESVAVRVALAEALLAGRQPAAAVEECRAALRVDERNVPALVALATAWAGQRRFELARMVLENARALAPDDPAVWNRLGFVDLALGGRAQALADFERAAALGPAYPEAHANHGAMLAESDDFAGAAGELELATRQAPGLAGAWLDLGNARRGLQEFDAAESAYRKALELDPAMNDARFNLAILYLDGRTSRLPTLQRLEQGLGWFDQYERHGGQEPRVAAWRKDAAREIDREKKRLAREEKDRLRREAEARAPAETKGSDR